MCYIFVYVRVSAYVRVYGYGCAGVCLRACSLTNPACSALCIAICGLCLHHIFWHYLINGTIFGKELLNIKCVFWLSLQLLCETFLILRRIQRDVINVKNLHVKYLLLLSDFHETWIFSTDFREEFRYQISPILPVGAELFCEDRQTDGRTDWQTWRS